MYVYVHTRKSKKHVLDLNTQIHAYNQCLYIDLFAYLFVNSYPSYLNRNSWTFCQPCLLVGQLQDLKTLLTFSEEKNVEANCEHNFSLTTWLG